MSRTLLLLVGMTWTVLAPWNERPHRHLCLGPTGIWAEPAELGCGDTCGPAGTSATCTCWGDDLAFETAPVAGITWERSGGATRAIDYWVPRDRLVPTLAYLLLTWGVPRELAGEPVEERGPDGDLRVRGRGLRLAWSTLEDGLRLRVTFSDRLLGTGPGAAGVLPPGLRDGVYRIRVTPTRPAGPAETRKEWPPPRHGGTPRRLLVARVLHQPPPWHEDPPPAPGVFSAGLAGGCDRRDDNGHGVAYCVHVGIVRPFPGIPADAVVRWELDGKVGFLDYEVRGDRLEGVLTWFLARFGAPEIRGDAGPTRMTRDGRVLTGEPWVHLSWDVRDENGDRVRLRLSTRLAPGWGRPMGGRDNYFRITAWKPGEDSRWKDVTVLCWQYIPPPPRREKAEPPGDGSIPGNGQRSPFR